jgi:hypothetical protein
MPIHDWTRVSFGTFHNFHQGWTITLRDALNAGRLPAGKPLTLAAYQCLPNKTAYVEPVAAGDPLPEMPLFLRGEWHVKAPLEETYQAAWGVMPPPIKRLFDRPPPG